MAEEPIASEVGQAHSGTATWYAFYSESAQREYYYNPHARVVTWVMPDDYYPHSHSTADNITQSKASSHRLPAQCPPPRLKQRVSFMNEEEEDKPTAAGRGIHFAEDKRARDNPPLFRSTLAAAALVVFSFGALSLRQHLMGSREDTTSLQLTKEIDNRDLPFCEKEGLDCMIENMVGNEDGGTKSTPVKKFQPKPQNKGKEHSQDTERSLPNEEGSSREVLDYMIENMVGNEGRETKSTPVKKFEPKPQNKEKEHSQDTKRPMLKEKDSSVRGNSGGPLPRTFPEMIKKDNTDESNKGTNEAAEVPPVLPAKTTDGYSEVVGIPYGVGIQKRDNVLESASHQRGNINTTFHKEHEIKSNTSEANIFGGTKASVAQSIVEAKTWTELSGGGDEALEASTDGGDKSLVAPIGGVEKLKATTPFVVSREEVVDGYEVPSELTGPMGVYPDPLGITDEMRASFHPVLKFPMVWAASEGGTGNTVNSPALDSEKGFRWRPPWIKKGLRRVPDYQIIDHTRTTGSSQLIPLEEAKEYAKRRRRGASSWSVGRYDEDRGRIYSSDIFQDGGRSVNGHDRAMTVHVGIDLGGPVGTKVHAFADGIVHSAGYNPELGGYGHVVVLEHELLPATTGGKKGSPPRKVWALYGHLKASSVHGKKQGKRVRKGQVLGWIGDVFDNGGWILPHVHFQLSIHPPETHDMPATVSHKDRPRALVDYPDPRMVLGPLY